ncbi:MAG: FGGY-family carbohydrate kinase, partial [Armatimonadota bacterium]
MSLMGIDVGTTGIKAAVFDVTGKLLSVAYEEYPLLFPFPGASELEPQRVAKAAYHVIGEAARKVEGADPVRAVGIASQGEAFIPMGSDGEILGNAMVSSDSRAASVSASWSEEFGCENLYHITGHTPHFVFTLFKLLWLKENRPDIWSSARSYYCFEEFIQHKLGLDPAISWPLAGRTMMFDIHSHEWSEKILKAAGIDRSSLARTLPSSAIVGAIPQSVARELALPDGVIVVTGGHDQPCGALGAGIIAPGRAVYAIGTVECITPAFPEP